MNSIQAEQLRQAIMLQGGNITPQQVVFLKTNPMANDSFNNSGKKSGLGLFTKVALIAAAVIFRKNIVNVAKKYFPNISQDIATAAKGVGEKLSKVKGSGYVKSGWKKYVQYENQAKTYISEKLATETGVKVKNKATGVWDWLKGLVIKKPEGQQMKFDL